MKNILLSFCLLVGCIWAHAQVPSLGDIDSLTTISSSAFDSIFGFTGLTEPVNFIEKDLSPHSTWNIQGRIVDFTPSIGCGSCLCTAGTLKVLLADSTALDKEQFVYVVMLGLNEHWVSQNKEVSLPVRYLRKDDREYLSIIFNKFHTAAPFLIYEI